MTADGYHEGEVFLPVPKELETVEGIVVQLRRQAPGTAPEVPRQGLAGTVARGGQPVRVGWVSLWAPVKQESNAPNASVQRGRTVPRGGVKYGAARIAADGSFALDVPFQGEWYVVVEEPGQGPTVVGPLAVGLNEERQLSLACTAGGTITGRVGNVPDGMEDHLWVVAFGRAVVRAEARVAPDGTFRLNGLPPGEYGLKAGHDAYEDAEVPRAVPGQRMAEGAWKAPATPWKRATVVAVVSGRMVRDIELELPLA